MMEKIINGYYFEFDEQDLNTILVGAYVTSTKPNTETDKVPNEKTRVQALLNMYRDLSELPNYVVNFGNPAPARAQGTDFLVTAVRGAVSRKDRSRITLEELETLITEKLTPDLKKP